LNSHQTRVGCSLALNEHDFCHFKDVYSIINSKSAAKYAGIEVEAMRAVADAHKKRDIHEFDRVYSQYGPQLAGDALIFSQLSDLKNNLLEQNLLRLVEPFARVEVAHVANLIKLPRQVIEAKLSEMVLDKKLAGILDQNSGYLILFDVPPSDKTYEAAVSTVKELAHVVDRLYNRSRKLNV